MRRDKRDINFMSYKGRVIWYRNAGGVISYLVAKGDGTDEHFKSWQDAARWIDNKKRVKR